MPPMAYVTAPAGPGAATLALALAPSSFTAAQYLWSLTVTDSLRSVQYSVNRTTTINYPPVTVSAAPMTITPTGPLAAMQSVTVATQASHWDDPDGPGALEYQLVYRVGTHHKEMPVSASGWSPTPSFAFTAPATHGDVTFLLYVRDALGAVSVPTQLSVPTQPLSADQILTTLRSYPLADPSAISPEELRAASELLPQVQERGFFVWLGTRFGGPTHALDGDGGTHPPPPPPPRNPRLMISTRYTRDVKNMKNERRDVGHHRPPGWGTCTSPAPARHRLFQDKFHRIVTQVWVGITVLSNLQSAYGSYEVGAFA